MSTVLAIDPGPEESAYALINLATRRPIRVEKLTNPRLLLAIRNDTEIGTATYAAVEMVASYGMAVGADVFETCVWIGRYQEALLQRADRRPVDRIVRLRVKTHHCHDSKAKDSNITQALIDRFAPGQPNRGKGTKTDPGWFHGFRADIWQAYALAVLVADQHDRQQAV